MSDEKQAGPGRPLDEDRGREMREAALAAGEPLTAGEISRLLGLSRKAAPALLEARQESWRRSAHGRWHPADTRPYLLDAAEARAVERLRRREVEP